jgi:hypothetical protein
MVRNYGFTALLALALAGCSGAPEEAQTADANGVDPALASALQDQIMVDPALAQQANGDAVRPPGQPYSGGVPHESVATDSNGAPTEGLMKAPAPTQADKSCTNCAAGRDAVTLAGLAEAQGGGAGSCAANIQYSAAWATRLPADVPLYPQARVTEAGGANGGSCALRAVSFSAGANMQNLLDWYYTKMVKAGYTAEHQVDGAQHILGGTRARDDGAFVIYLTARPDGGTDVDLIANNGV